MKKLIALTLLALTTMAGSALTEPLSSTEYEIKAAFLYNFAKFVEWPPDAFPKNSDNFVIGILGRDPFGSTLDDLLEGKTIQDKKLVLKRVETAEQASHCNVLFISASKEDELPAILSTIQGLPILTVSDMSAFINHGGVVGFSLEGKKVRFSVNTKAADSAGLKVSSQLLKLAKTIVSKCPLDLETYAWLPFETIPYKRS